MRWPIPETTLIMTDANIADQNDVIVREELQRAVSSSIAALIIIRKSPAVKITAGKVINLRNDPKKVFMTEKIRATHK